MRFRVGVTVIAVILGALPGAAAASGTGPKLELPTTFPSECVAGDAARAGAELFGAGTEVATADQVAGLTTMLVLEPYIAPGTRHRMVGVPGGWCDAETGFNHAWQANGRSLRDGSAVAAAYARLAAAPYFDQTTVTSQTSVAGLHTIRTHALTNGVEAQWTIVTDPSGVLHATWASTGFAVKPFVAQWEGLTALDGATEKYTRLSDGSLTPDHGLPTGQRSAAPAAEVSYTGPDGFKIVVGIGDTRNAVDVGQDVGETHVDLLRMVRDVTAQNYQDFYEWGFHADWAPARTRFLVLQGGTATNIGPPNTGYISINDSTSAYCQACVFIADDFQIHMISEVRTFLEALGYAYPGASDRDVWADVLGHEMFHDWQNNYVKPTSSGRSVPGSYSEGTARMQETLHTYSGASHQPSSLVYANDANGCNGFNGPNPDATMAGGPFQTPAYAACNFWLPWYGARGRDTLAKLVMEGAPNGAAIPGVNNAGKMLGALQFATGEPYARSAVEWVAGLITGKNMTFGPAVGEGEIRDWGQFLERWDPLPLAPGDSASATLSNGGVMARRVDGSFTASVTEGAVLAVLRDSPAATTITYPAEGESIPGPGADEKVYVIAIHPGMTPLPTTISLEAGSPDAPPEPPPPPADPVATTLYMDGSAPIGEGEGLAYLSLVGQAPASEKSMQLINYVQGPNTACAGNALFPVFVGPLSGRVTGDIDVTFGAVSTGGAVDIRVWPDVSVQGCNEAYPKPAREERVSLPSGDGPVTATLSGADFDATGQLMIQVTPVTASPFVGRMFYGTAASKVDFQCAPTTGTSCIP